MNGIDFIIPVVGAQKAPNEEQIRDIQCFVTQKLIEFGCVRPESAGIYKIRINVEINKDVINGIRNIERYSSD